MKRWIFALWMVALCVAEATACSLCHGSDNTQQRLTREEFRAKQREFITQCASLTPEEADAFFPLYFELQDRKKELNDEAWKLMKKGERREATEKQYEEMMETMYDTRIAVDRLEKTYYEKFKKVLSFKKIFMVQRAEMRFHREVLRNFGQNDRPGRPKGEGRPGGPGAPNRPDRQQ